MIDALIYDWNRIDAPPPPPVVMLDDETLRDGLQSASVRTPTIDQKIRILHLIDALGIDKAHVCGASMGGMIAQHAAARYPERVKSLTLMMTTSGARRLPGASLKVRGAMISRPKDQQLATIVEHYVGLYGLIGSPAYPPGKDYLRERIANALPLIEERVRGRRPAVTKTIDILMRSVMGLTGA